MSIRSCCVVALLACLLVAPAAVAQQNAPSSGVWVDGKYYGHNPGRRAGFTPPRRQPAQRQVAKRSQPSRPAASVEPAHAEHASYEPAYPDDQFELTGCESGFCEQGLCDLGCCDADCCCDPVGCGDLCRPRQRCYWYAGGEYLYGWTKGVEVPALVTTSDTGTLQADAGVLGLASTDVLLGNETLNNGGQSGVRFILGADCGSCRKSGVAFIYSYFDASGEDFAYTSDTTPILARPFFNVDTNAENALLIGFPTQFSGTLGVSAQSEFSSYEMHYRREIKRWCGHSFDMLLGYRAMDLSDSLEFTQTTNTLAGANAGTVTDLQDSFSTSNTFHGGQLGFECRLIDKRRLSCDCSFKTAIGGTQQKVRVAGSTTVTPSGGSATTTEGGLLAQQSNSGTYTRGEVASVSELGVTFRYRLRPRVSLICGYNAVFWSDVMRAGGQVDLGLNPSQLSGGTLVGEARPAVPYNSSEYWVQQLRFGVDTRY